DKTRAQSILKKRFLRVGPSCALLSPLPGGSPSALSASKNAWGPPFWLWRDDGTLSARRRSAALDPRARARYDPALCACRPAQAGPIPGLHRRLHARPSAAPAEHETKNKHASVPTIAQSHLIATGYRTLLSDLPAVSRLRSYSASPAEAFSVVLGGSRSERSFASSLSRRTISVVVRMSASLKSAPIVEAIARNRALNSR